MELVASQKFDCWCNRAPAVSPALYKSLLEPAGFRLDHLEPVAPEHSVPKRVGREFLGLWTRAV